MSTEGNPQSIGVAVVEHRGRYLVGLRGPDGPLAGFAEFPGGKCLPKESPGVAACRECLEETGLPVKTVDLLMRRTFVYAHGPVDLHFWLCRPADPETVADRHQDFRWVPGVELDSLKFPEANLPLIRELVERAQAAHARER
jgi:mutator protein MutT